MSQWTNEAPTEEGYYWWQSTTGSKKNRSQIVLFANGVWWIIAHQFGVSAEDMGGEWLSEPLAAPKEG